jgi:predicted amidohydrolase
MFDVQLAGVGGQSYRESSTFRPGERSVLAETPWGVLGMTICYEPALPYLYRDLAHRRRDDCCRSVILHRADRQGALAHR